MNDVVAVIQKMLIQPAQKTQVFADTCAGTDVQMNGCRGEDRQAEKWKRSLRDVMIPVTQSGGKIDGVPSSGAAAGGIGVENDEGDSQIGCY